MEGAIEAGEFYDRLCASLCQVVSFDRAALLVYDHGFRGVRVAGVVGVDREVADRLEATMEETPIAQRALEQDEVIEVTDELASQIPGRYAELAGEGTLTCTPVRAGGRWMGVLVGDRGGDRFELSPAERRALMSFGRVAALAASVERGTSQRERARRLSERVALTREIHEHVIQRLFGVSLALGADGDLGDAERKRCELELQGVVGELRSALSRPLAGSRRDTDATLRQVLDRLQRRRPELRVEWADGLKLPLELESLAQSIVYEALTNADKHARASEIEIRPQETRQALTLEIVNDGVHAEGGRGAGLGLRLAAFDALDHRGVVEFGPLGGERWRVRLLIPRRA
jgi:signal transduction histidine kinase